MAVRRGLEVTSREELIYLLAVAAELEHGLCLQYLFAAFSLKRSLADGGLTDAQLTAVRTWRANILAVAAQEMMHFCQAANLATAIGATAHLRRPNFPQPRGYYPTDLPWTLAPFSETTMRRFICYERPEGWHEPGFDCGHADPEYAVPVTEPPLEPVAVRHATVAELYGAIGQAFATLEPPGGLFIGEPRAQVPGALVDFPQLVEVRDRASAARAVELIVEQGEGTPHDRDDSHFGIFRRILADYLDARRRDPGFDPVLPVARNPMTRRWPDNRGGAVTLVTEPFTADVAELGNAVYGTLVLMLYRLFALPAREGARRTTYAQVSLRLMTAVISGLADALTHLPVGGHAPGRTAGPGFEVDPTLELLPDARSSDTYVLERLLQAAGRAHELAAVPSAPAALAGAAATLDGLAAAFRQGTAPPPRRAAVPSVRSRR